MKNLRFAIHLALAAASLSAALTPLASGALQDITTWWAPVGRACPTYSTRRACEAEN